MPGGTGAVCFRPDNAKFLKTATGNVDLKANTCANCACIALAGDVEKVKSLTA